MAEQRVANNKLVEFTYEITDQHGALVEKVDVNLDYVHGTDSGMFDKIEQSLAGKRAGDSITVTLTPEEGFGYPDPELTYTDDLNNVPNEYRQLGTEVEMQNDRGETKTFVVSKIENGKLTVDGNHPLTGKTLHFTLEIHSVRDATPEELQAGGTPSEMKPH